MFEFATTYDKHTKIWTGSKFKPTYHFDHSIGKILHSALKNYKDNIVQISDTDGKQFTNQELLQCSIRIAQHLKKWHLNHEDVVGVATQHASYATPAILGCFFNATPFHTVNPIYSKETIQHIFNITKPKVIFCDGSIYNVMSVATKMWNPLIYILDDHMEGIANIQDLLEPTTTEIFYEPEDLTLGGDQTVAILNSSGTTGLPKAVCISNHHMVLHKNMFNNDDVFLILSSLDWMSGIYFLVFSCISGATRIITKEPFSADLFTKLCKKYKATLTLLPPRGIAALNNMPNSAEALATIKMISIGGETIEIRQLTRLRQLIPKAFIQLGYGMTEFGGISVNLSPHKGNSVGRLTPNVRLRIVNDKGNNCGPNEEGEIWVWNGLNWNGYYGNPMETIRMRDSMGWFHTGDIGYMDNDNYLFISGRKKEVLRYHSIQYWPGEIEKVIAELPDVADVAVIGVYNELDGYAAGAVIIKKKGSNITESDIIKHVAEKMEKHKHLHAGVRFVDTFPQTGSGKVLKRDLTALFDNVQVKR